MSKYYDQITNVSYRKKIDMSGIIKFSQVEYKKDNLKIGDVLKIKRPWNEHGILNGDIYVEVIEKYKHHALCRCTKDERLKTCINYVSLLVDN